MFWPRILGHKEDKLWVDDSGSISFQSPPKLSFLWQVCSSSLPYSAVEIKHITHFPRDTFPRRAHFVIMDFLRNRTENRFIWNLEHWCWEESICINFRPPIPVLYVSAQSAPISWVLPVGDSWQDNRLPSTRDLGYSLPNLPPIHRLAAGDRYGRAQDIRNTKISPKNISYIHDRYCGAEFKIFLRNSKISAYILGQEPLRR